MKPVHGLSTDLGSLTLLSNARSRSISPENPTGEKGGGARSVDGPAAAAARGMGQGWKVAPLVHIEPGQTYTMALIDGPGVIQHIWLTPTGTFRHSILRIHWDDQEQPSVECPVGDFFGNSAGEYAQLSSLAVCANPRSGLNCY